MFSSTKIIELGSCAFRQPQADSHCRFLHGYRLTAKFWFEADRLDQNNWVVDFGGLKGLKKLMKDQFDHTTCISRTDPKLEQFKRLRDEGVCDLRVMDGVGIEKFAEYCYTVANEYVDELTDSRCKCVKVEVFEHENNSAIYTPFQTQKMSFTEKTTEEVAEEIATASDLKKDSKNVTQPPFKQGIPAPVGNKKVTNQWIDPESPNTWGI